jgi:hypothetical protein
MDTLHGATKFKNSRSFAGKVVVSDVEVARGATLVAHAMYLGGLDDPPSRSGSALRPRKRDDLETG